MLHHILFQINELIRSPIFNTSQIHFSLLIVSGFIFLSLIVYYLRYIHILGTLNTLLGFFPTLIHELGHALLCSLTFGKVTDIRVMITQYGQHKNSANGYTKMIHRLWLGQVLSVFAGYLFPSIIILFLVYELMNQHMIIFFIMFALLMLYYLLKTRQKLVAFTVILIMFVSVINLMKVNEQNLMIVINFIVNGFLGIMLAHMIISIRVRTILAFKEHNDTWDGAQLKHLTLIPQSVYYLLWLVCDIIILWLIFNLLR